MSNTALKTSETFIVEVDLANSPGQSVVQVVKITGPLTREVVNRVVGKDAEELYLKLNQK